jgi:hypothetical protein
VQLLAEYPETRPINRRSRVMGSDNRQSKGVNPAPSKKAHSAKTKSTKSKTKKGTPRDENREPKVKKTSKKGLGMPAEVDTGPEGDVSKTNSDI